MDKLKKRLWLSYAILCGLSVLVLAFTQGWANALGLAVGLFLLSVVYEQMVVNLLVQTVDQFSHQQQNTKQEAILTEATEQMLHDVRSPLAALTVAFKSLAALPHENRLLIQNALQRLNGIVNDLQQQKSQAQDQGLLSRATAKHMISCIALEALDEKRLQFKGTDIDLCSNISGAAYGCFVKTHQGQLRRVLSNLLNNAIEASETAGQVNVVINDLGQWVRVSVQDFGAGIPKELLAKVTQKGFTRGKKKGSGLGLYHAQSMMQAWGGRLKIESQPGFTTVSLYFPKQKAPHWFMPRLHVKPGSQLVVLDEDSASVSLWLKRCQKNGLRDVQVLYFSCYQELKTWLSQANEKNRLFLLNRQMLSTVPYAELERLGLIERAIFIVQDYQWLDHGLIAKETSMKALPKNLLGHIPFKKQVVAPILCGSFTSYGSHVFH